MYGEGGRRRLEVGQVLQPFQVEQCSHLAHCPRQHAQHTAIRRGAFHGVCVGVHPPRATSRWRSAMLANTFQQSWLSMALAKDQASWNLFSAMHLSKDVRNCMTIRVEVGFTWPQLSGLEYASSDYMQYRPLLSVELYHIPLPWQPCGIRSSVPSTVVLLTTNFL